MARWGPGVPYGLTDGAGKIRSQSSFLGSGTAVGSDTCFWQPVRATIATTAIRSALTTVPRRVVLRPAQRHRPTSDVPRG